MIYKCKSCGGQVTIDSKNGVVICDYCGTKQAMPLFTADSERLLYDRGNNYLLHSEYDKAENVFNQLLTIKPGAAELYWDLVLCKYGVTYVKDPKNGKYIPTCNRTHYAPIFSDENYRKAIELSSGEKRALFAEDAKTIDAIQKGIIAVARKEKPFDIFISYKETDANGNRTKDSIEAQKLYEKLTECGYKVFFSRITLEDKIGTEYEPYIYAALYASKVMLTVCSSKENIEAVWVKNEWSRFLGFRQIDNSKTLLPLYFDMDKADLPEEFALLSAYDIHTDGFVDELLRGIKKLIPLPIMSAKRRKKILKTTGIVAASLVLVAGIAAAILIPKRMEEKRLAEEEAIRASEAAALEKATEEAYQEAMILFDNADYTAAEAAFIALGEYKDSAEMAIKCSMQAKYVAAMELFNNADYGAAEAAFVALGDYKDSPEMAIKSNMQPKYDAAMQLYYDSNYPGAAWAFKELAGFNDASQMQNKAERAWREALVTIATSNSLELEVNLGAYYISSNGSVGNFDGYPGNASVGLEINAHGKIVSIADNYALYALYEDGYVYNSAKNNCLDSDWTDVIQITPVFNSTNVALKSDGTVLYGNLQNPYDESLTDNWLKPVSTWKNIVSLGWSLVRMGFSSDLYIGTLYGIDIDGNVYAVYYDSCDDELPQESLIALTSLKNIKLIDICISKEEIQIDWSFVALDNEGTLIRYANGKTQQQKNTNYTKAIDYGETIIVLDSKKTLSMLNSDKDIMEDVVYFDGEYIVTRSGSIYRYRGWSATPENTQGKTKVKTVWLEGRE